MNLKTVTITGADDSVEPRTLVELSQEFPFVEWGILLSKSQEGGKRFPTRAWTNQLADLVDDHGLDEPVNLSGHLCGSWCRSIALGAWTVPYLPVLDYLKRVQLNFHAARLVVDILPFMNLLRGIMGDNGFTTREIIFQIDGVNNQQFHAACNYGIPAFPLFDLSHGAGILPGKWPAPISRYCGYAGGLGPDNIEAELHRIAEAVASIPGDLPFWIDMETRVRSDDDRVFDIAKVRRVLEITAPFIKEEELE